MLIVDQMLAFAGFVTKTKKNFLNESWKMQSFMQTGRVDVTKIN